MLEPRQPAEGGKLSNRQALREYIVLVEASMFLQSSLSIKAESELISIKYSPLLVFFQVIGEKPLQRLYTRHTGFLGKRWTSS